MVDALGVLKLLLISALCAGAAAEVSSTHGGVLCAYRPQASGLPYYAQYEEDGPPLGEVVGNGTSMRCTLPTSYCFSLWRDLVDEANTSRRVFVLQGCMNIKQAQAQCDQEACVAHGEDLHMKNTRFCCCNRHRCNADVSFVPLPVSSDAADRHHPVQDRDPVLIVVIVSVLLVCAAALLAVGGWLWYRRPPPAPPAPAEPAPLTPTVDLAELKLTEVIGRGRYGEVRKGLLFGEDVAVKVFPAYYRHYFMSERDVYSLPWMEHPSLPHFYGADERALENGSEYLLVLSYVPLGTVHDYLRANTLTFAQMCRMAATAVSGLAHLHTPIEHRGLTKPAVAHRDVNSRNILVRADGSCCLCDLGFAMKISGGRYFSNGEEQDAETTSLTDVGTLRYMAPEVLEGAVNLRDCETALKQVDMYAMALVLWELASRCADLCQGLEMAAYKLPFEAEIGPHPSFDQMQVLVARNRARPLFPDVWKESNPALRQLRETIEDSWDQDGEARLTALCMLERIAELPLLWERYKGNLGLNGTLPTLNLVAPLSDPEKVKSDVNVLIADAHEAEASEMTAETLLTLSPDQEMNLRNSQVSAAVPAYSSQIQPHQGRNPCIERNLACGDRSGDYTVHGNTLVERQALSPAAPNGVVPSESQALLSPSESTAPLRATPIPIVQNPVHGGGASGGQPEPVLAEGGGGGGWAARLRAVLPGHRRRRPQPVALQPVGLPSKTVNVDAEAGECGAAPGRPGSLPL